MSSTMVSTMVLGNIPGSPFLVLAMNQSMVESGLNVFVVMVLSLFIGIASYLIVFNGLMYMVITKPGTTNVRGLTWYKTRTHQMCIRFDLFWFYEHTNVEHIESFDVLWQCS
jgi:hypothetical protein